MTFDLVLKIVLGLVAVAVLLIAWAGVMIFRAERQYKRDMNKALDFSWWKKGRS